MSPSPPDSRPTLDYSRPCPADQSNWPTGLYVASLFWAFATLYISSAITNTYRHERDAELRTQIALVALAAGHLVVARLRSERNRGWIFYVCLLMLALPLWLLIARPLEHLGRSLWGVPFP